MLLKEANERLKKVEITEEQLWGLNSIYIILDLHKDDFCRIVDLVGLETLLKKQSHYDRVLKAEEELAAKEKFLAAKLRLSDLEKERQHLEKIVKSYTSMTTGLL